MNFTVCVDALFMHKDFIESVELLAKNGIKNIEFWGWWDKDLDRLYKLKNQYDLNIVAFCSKFVSMVDVNKQEEYLEGLKESCETAARFGCKILITKPLDKLDIPFEDQFNAMVSLLKKAGEICASFDVTLLIEPVNNRYEDPKTFLPDSTLGFEIIHAVDHPNIQLLYDIYHMQIDEGDILNRLIPNISHVKHIHAAGSNERHELDDGELNYPYIFKKIDETDYEGYVGLEYFPADTDIIQGIISVLRYVKS